MSTDALHLLNHIRTKNKPIRKTTGYAASQKRSSADKKYFG